MMFSKEGVLERSRIMEKKWNSSSEEHKTGRSRHERVEPRREGDLSVLEHKVI